MYETIKLLHVALAGVTGVGLLLRLGLVAADSPLMQKKAVTLSYAAVDGLIVLLGLILVVMIPNKEITLGNGWLVAKLIAWVGLFTTVFYGIKIAKQKPIKLVSLLVGLLCYIYIVMAAHHLSPLPF